MLGYLCGVFKRLFLFQFVFLFAYLKYKDLSTSSYEFKDKVYEFSTSVNFKHPKVDQLLSNPVLLFQIFVGAQAAFAVLALLGSRFFSFLTAVMVVLTNVIYNNPLKILNPTKKAGENPKPFNLNQIPLEFILMTILALAIFAQSFSKSCCGSAEALEAGKGVEETTDGRRDAKVSSQKKKRI